MLVWRVMHAPESDPSTDGRSTPFAPSLRPRSTRRKTQANDDDTAKKRGVPSKATAPSRAPYVHPSAQSHKITQPRTRDTAERARRGEAGPGPGERKGSPALSSLEPRSRGEVVVGLGLGARRNFEAGRSRDLAVWKLIDGCNSFCAAVGSEGAARHGGARSG